MISQGVTPISSTTKVHGVADHGAWVIYIFAVLYKIYANINWLFITQAIGLSFTAIPLWLICKKKDLKSNLSWLVCAIWWLQPIVFNVNLFDFHPEVWAMPALAGCYLASKNNNLFLWFILAFFVIGCRDGMVLITAGIGIEQIIRKHWKFAITSLLLSLGWLLFISKLLFPYLKKYSEGSLGATESMISNFNNFLISPVLEVQKIDLLGGVFYLILISIVFIPFWNRKSLVTLSGCIPLVFLNTIAINPSFRTLIHQYNLPVALIGVVSIIDALAINRNQTFPWLKLFWVSLCWISLAKPYFFTGPYLKRLPDAGAIYKAIKIIPRDANVITTSYIVPHLSHRKNIIHPREDGENINSLKDFDTILLTPKDPGWNSNAEVQSKILINAKDSGWQCKHFNNGLELCKNE